MSDNREMKIKKKSIKLLHILVIIVGILAVISSSAGIFSSNGGAPFIVTNLYGDSIRMWGNGIYQNDSYFKAPLFRGTDLAMLLFCIPVLFIGLIQDIRKATLKSRLFLLSVLGAFIYNSASYAFGVTYNQIFLVYILLLTVSLFAFISGIRSIDIKETGGRLNGTISKKGIYIYSFLTGLALFVAWLPDIINSLVMGTPLSIIDTYTTEITYVIDMGILAPLFFASIYLIHRNDGLGYVSFLVLSMLSILIVPVLCLQSVFQTVAGIETPIAAAITKIGSFVLLGIWAVVLQRRIYKKM